jgi:hypothetical protein
VFDLRGAIRHLEQLPQVSGASIQGARGGLEAKADLVVGVGQKRTRDMQAREMLKSVIAIPRLAKGSPHQP